MLMNPCNVTFDEVLQKNESSPLMKKKLKNRVCFFKTEKPPISFFLHDVIMYTSIQHVTVMLLTNLIMLMMRFSWMQDPDIAKKFM
jgi:hypothetical protein